MSVITVVVMAVVILTMRVKRLRRMIVAVVTLIVVMRGIGIMRIVRRMVADLCGICVRLGIAFRARAFNDLALDTLAAIAAPGTAMTRTPAAGAIFVFFLGFAVRTLVGLDQGLTIGNRDLIVIGMDFAEGKETVTVAAVLNEGGLQ
jgi:hypothetical protein